MVKYILILFFVFSSAHANELRIGAGVNYGNLIGDGVWIQEGLDNRIENGKPSFLIQYLGTVSGIPFGIGLAHRKGPMASGEYVSDDCYFGTYGARLFSGGPWSDSAGMPACDRRYFAKRVKAETNAIVLTVIPTWQATENLSLSVGLGVSFFVSTLEVEWDRSRGVCATPSLCDDLSFKNRGRSAYADLTVKYSNFFVTGYYADSETAQESMADGNRGFIIGYAMEI